MCDRVGMRMIHGGSLMIAWWFGLTSSVFLSAERSRVADHQVNADQQHPTFDHGGIPHLDRLCLLFLSSISKPSTRKEGNPSFRMLRQASSRNHRVNGGFREKNALQIGVLVAVCLWLLYRMKCSHDQRKAYEDRFGDDERVAMFGREGLLPDTLEAASLPAEGRTHVVKHEELEKREHEERSHEAQEQSFKGDDASSEVVHGGHEAEHEERVQAAQERSFEADDASSAVDHVVRVKESESGNILFDPAETTNSSLVHEGTVLEKRPSSRTAPGESDKQEELGMRSRDSSKDEIKVRENYTAISEDWIEAERNQSTAVHPTIAVATAEPEVPWQEESDSPETTNNVELVIQGWLACKMTVSEKATAACTAMYAWNYY
ncbi:hypothetical protein C4D60_Mb01t01750 [Musa balbisiana]|uniref:Uncharacterized protein n=1 Tax=Musa balbisiana TaxID=52838 RepID=A0A4S8JJX4_MUSBA|nr:hypothetical protein C4D60_Mb01t01750 [Musa balbisiana]